MSLLLQRARRVAWNFTDSSKSDTASVDSGYAEPKIISRPTTPRPVQRIGRSAGLEKIVEAIKQDGCVVVKDFTDLATLADANEELRPYLEVQKDEDSRFDGWRGRTQIVTQLMRRSPTIREKFFTDDLYQTLCEFFLSTETVTWNGSNVATNVSHPLLSSAITFDIPHNSSGQGFHRDDQYYHARHTQVNEYEMGRDMLLGLFVAGSNVHEDTAMKVVVGSHLWGDDEPPLDPASDTEVTSVALQQGEAFIMLGSLYYGQMPGKAIWESTEESSLLHAMFSCSGVYRQEENPFLTYSSKEVSTYSDLVQERLGWKQKEPSLGWVDLRSPEFLLRT